MGLHTPLYDWHVSHGARIVDFGGWDMPVHYSSISAEHNATRQSAGLFDISHMGRLRFTGPEAGKLLDHLLTNRVDNLKLGQIRYSLMLNESAGTLDDVLVYRVDDGYLLVVNAGNRLKILDWVKKHLPRFDARLEDKTASWGMIALQGPRALEIAQPFVGRPLTDIRYYFCVETAVNGLAGCMVSRTGYTGEDGIEIVVPAERTADLASRILQDGASAGCQPVGLGARDTLRLEAAMPLYGHELSETIDPIQAGLAWAVKAKDKDFVGKDALLRRPADRPVRIGLMLDGKRIAREGFEIRLGDRNVGRVTSGSFTPTVQAAIAMGYVEPAQAGVGTDLDVVIRDQPNHAKVVSIPFYKRESAS